MPENEEALTAGYPRIEKLIETEEFDTVNKSFEEAYEQLSKIAKSKKGLGQGKAADKALKAYELTLDLFKELLKLKYQMMEAIEKEGKSK